MNTIASEWLGNYLHIFYYKKKFIRRTVLCTLGLSLLVYLLPPPVYHGTFSVLVRTSDLDTTLILPGTGVYVQPESVNPGVMSSEQALLTSDRALDRALAETYKKYPDFSFSPISYCAQPISGLSTLLSSLLPAEEKDPDKEWHERREAFRKKIEATPVPGSRTIEVRISFYDREILTELQKNLLEAYLSSRGDLVTNPSGQSVYSQDSQKYGQSWRDLLDESAKIRAKTNIYDVPVQRGELISQLNSVQRETDMLGLRLNELNGQIVDVQAARDVVGMQLSNVRNTQVFVQLEGDIARLEVEKAALLGEYTSKNPVVRSKQISIDHATDRYRSLLLNTLTTARQETENRLTALIAIMARLQERLRELDTLANTLQALEQETILARESYQTYARKLREVELQTMLRNSSDSSIAVVRSHFVDTRPFWPNALILFPLALFLGLFFGLIGAYVDYYFEDIVLQPRDFTFTNLPVLGFLPDVAES